MAIDEILDIELVDVEAVVGSATFGRGCRYAAESRVLNLRWDPATRLLTARVVGNGHVYSTDVHLGYDSVGRTTFAYGSCSCPVGMDCKHAVAVVATALTVPDLAAPESTSSPEGSSRRTGNKSVAPDWERVLEPMLPSATEAVVTGSPIAIEITLRILRSAAGAVSLRLDSRLVRRGRSGWVRSGVSWGDLERWSVARYDLDERQVLIAREIYALWRAATMQTGYYWSGAATTIDLNAVGPGLWPLLARARAAGISLIHDAHLLGEVELGERADIRLDAIAAPDGSLELAPSLVLDGADEWTDVVPVGFVGAEAHGVVFVRRDELDSTHDVTACRLGLARLRCQAPPALSTMLGTGGNLVIPACDVARFASHVWPRLRHVCEVVSSDGSFEPPTITAPTLELLAGYGEGHTVDLTWNWLYGVGGDTRRAAPGSDAALTGFRDLDAEREILASLNSELADVLDVGSPLVGLPGAGGHLGPGAPMVLAGLDTLSFTTEVLPLLKGDRHVSVEVSGDPASFRDVDDSVEIEVSTGTDEATGATDWLDLDISIIVEGRKLAFAHVFRALASGESRMLLDDGAHFSLETPQLATLRALIEEARALDDQPPDSLRVSRYQISWWDELAGIGIVDEQMQGWLGQVRALRELDSIVPADLPSSMLAELRPYQHEGFTWLAFLWAHGLGGILADDMGLGKTLQALALIAHANEEDPSTGPFLVVAPTSVVSNWAHEAHRFTPGLSVTTITDTLAKSGRTIEEAVGDADVVVTSYTLARLDAEAHRGVQWAGMLLDEAQQTKNHRSKIYSALRQIPAPFKVAITGTPMENNLMELWSLLSLAAPGLFPDPGRFKEHYANPIERKSDADRLAHLRRRIKPLVVRRTKELVAAELPDKLENVVSVDLHPKHRRIYETHLARERQKVMGLIAADFDRNRFTILKSITRLRQLSLHPVLVDKTHPDIPCAKIDLLVDQLVEVVEGGHRALVFSQFTGFLRLVRDRLDSHGIDHCYLDGRTRKRDVVIDRFTSGEADVFLISLKAGGVGLNLTGADYCFLLDPWWNPATEAQAIDRAHRIGQTRNVMVYRMIAADTIEEKVLALAERKAELFHGVMDEGDFFGGRLEADDIRGLFE